MKRFRPESPAVAGHSPTRRAVMAGAIAAAGACTAQSEQGDAQGAAGGEHPLWPRSGGPVLRGAAIAQRRRRLAVDGETFGGGAAVLPVYGAREFDALAAAGANLVVMSFPELWTVGPPWRRDEAMAEAMLAQMEAARAAGLFVVIGLRSGPGRSDFIFHRDAAGSWFPADLVVDAIWRQREAQAAWGEMCADATKLIAGRSEAAGLILMVEPEPNFGGLDHDGRQLGVWEPDAYAQRVGDVSDWKRIAGDCAKAVRAASRDLPVLISPPAFARTDFLPVMGAPPVPGTVWCVHDYEPRAYTHTNGRERGLRLFSENDPAFGQRLDAALQQNAPVFLGEFGASQAALSRPSYHRARIASCESRGVAWAVFRWPTFDAAYEQSDSTFDVTADRAPLRGDEQADTLDVLNAAWARNAVRP